MTIIFVRGVFTSTYHQLNFEEHVTSDDLRRRLVDENLYTKHQSKWMKLILKNSMEVIPNNTLIANNTQVLVLISEMHPVVIAYFDDGFYALDLYNLFLYKSTVLNLQNVSEVYDESSYCAPSNQNSLNQIFYCENESTNKQLTTCVYTHLPKVSKTFVDLFIKIANPTQHEVISFEHMQQIQSFEAKYKTHSLTLDEWIGVFPDVLSDGNRFQPGQTDPDDWKLAIKIMCQVDDDQVEFTFEEWMNRLETFYKVTKMNELNYDLQTLQKRSCFL